MSRETCSRPEFANAVALGAGVDGDKTHSLLRENPRKLLHKLGVPLSAKTGA